MTDSLAGRVGKFRPDPVETLGVLAMLVLVVASTLESGTTLQKVLFAVTPPALLVVAYLSDELMLAALEVVVLLGALIAFVPSLSPAVRFGLLGGAALLGVAYLVRIDYREADPYWPLGGAGLLLLAAGVSISGTRPLAFNALLVAGSLLLGTYSALGFLRLGARIQAIWIVLNVAFAVTPALRLLELLGVR